MDHKSIPPSDGDAKWDRLVPQIQRRRAERKARIRGYEAVVAEISRLLFRMDPMGISFDVNTDEYDPEAETIVPRLVRTSSEKDALDVVFEEFQRWFGTTGTRAGYEDVGREVWRVWTEYRAREAAFGTHEQPDV
jgi:hypothetical protein